MYTLAEFSREMRKISDSYGINGTPRTGPTGKAPHSSRQTQVSPDMGTIQYGVIMRPARGPRRKATPPDSQESLPPQRKEPQRSRNILGSLLRFLSGNRRNHKI
jgi:hypothetical protein